MKRRILLAANWKMHSPPPGWDHEDSPYNPREDMDIVVFPTLLDVPSCLAKFLVVGAQCGRPEPSGAFTGDVSMRILAAHGCAYVLCGHSERRRMHHEDDMFVAAQAKAALAAGLSPVVCVGETAEEREKGLARAVVERQVRSIEGPVIFAYEPVWAIGSGKAATPEQAQEMHAFLRGLLPEPQRESTRILYGGSVTAENIASFLAQADIDGALVGSASLDPKSFQGIVSAALTH
jgi:triosephosphate isomerase